MKSNYAPPAYQTLIPNTQLSCQNDVTIFSSQGGTPLQNNLLTFAFYCTLLVLGRPCTLKRSAQYEIQMHHPAGANELFDTLLHEAEAYTGYFIHFKTAPEDKLSEVYLNTLLLEAKRLNIEHAKKTKLSTIAPLSTKPPVDYKALETRLIDAEQRTRDDALEIANAKHTLETQEEQIIQLKADNIRLKKQINDTNALRTQLAETKQLLKETLERHQNEIETYKAQLFEQVNNQSIHEAKIADLKSRLEQLNRLNELQMNSGTGAKEILDNLKKANDQSDKIYSILFDTALKNAAQISHLEKNVTAVTTKSKKPEPSPPAETKHPFDTAHQSYHDIWNGNQTNTTVRDAKISDTEKCLLQKDLLEIVNQYDKEKGKWRRSKLAFFVPARTTTIDELAGLLIKDKITHQTIEKLLQKRDARFKWLRSGRLASFATTFNTGSINKDTVLSATDHAILALHQKIGAASESTASSSIVEMNGTQHRKKK